MQSDFPKPFDSWPWAPHRCPRCLRMDTIPMPAEHLGDKIIGCCGFAPFKCRACRAKFYRRSNTVPKPPARAPVAGSESSRYMAVCHGDRAVTLRRLEHLMMAAETMRGPKG